MGAVNTCRVALDVRTIQDHFPGIARYTYNLALALAREVPQSSWLLLTDAAQRNTLYDLESLRAQPNIELIDCRAPNFSLAEQWRLPALLRRREADIYHSPYYIMPYRVACPTVVTIHDLIPLRYPRYFTPIQRVAFGLTVRLAMRASKQVVADSEATANDLQQLLGVQRERLSVVYAAADPAMLAATTDTVAALRRRLGLPESFALYFGSNKPHKNLRLLVEACAAAPPNERFNLVVGGQWDSRLNEPKALAQTLGVDRHVQWLGPVAQSDLPALYSAASVFAFPSEYEGFGLPVLEAMACGTPVVSSNASSLPEVAGDAALLLAPNDPAAWSTALRSVLSNAELRTRLAAAGRRRAAQFSWAASARQMLAVYARL